MAVYVDDANIQASVQNGSRTHTSAWCHLTADTPDELHAFAARLGLKRSYFQPGTPLGGKPSPFWHYDVTAGKRAQAVALGAAEVPARDLPKLCREREARGAEADTSAAGRAVRQAGIAHSGRRPLAEQTAARLAAAGIGAGDPGLARIAAHNAALGIQHEKAATEKEAGQ